MRRLARLMLLLVLACFSQAGAQRTAVSQDSDLNTGAGVLSGTFLVPEGPTPMPVVLLIAGSGPTDRDGNSALLPGKNDAYRKLAEALAARGIASLRYDKRGVGRSAKAAIKEADLRFEDYVNDAANLVDLLKDDRRFSTITVVGHSEGSLIGMIAARISEADGFVSIAGPARAAPAIIRDQLRPQLATAPALWEQSESVLTSLEQGRTVDRLPPDLARIPGLASLYRPSVQPYLISWFAFTPSAELTKLTVPVLLIQGTTDLQVPVSEAEALAAAKPRARLVVVPGMNHLMKAVEGSALAQMPSYSDPSLPVVPAVPDAIAEMIRLVPARGR